MKKPDDTTDPLPQFDLPIENELLQLKLKAEFGAECRTGNQNIPHLVVNEFLKSVYEFEKKFREPRTSVRIYEKVGQPYFRKAELLNDEQITLELARILRCMEVHGLKLDVLGDYPDRVIYRFITEEFFYVEMDNIDMAGFVHHFCYEDFYPNHELDIRHRVVEFLSQWFAKKLNEYSWQLADTFLLPGKREVLKSQVVAKVNLIFEAYKRFSNCEYLVSQLEFEWDNIHQTGKALVTGRVRFDAVLEDGECVHVEGAYKFQLINNGSWWSINYFEFPGFDWR